MPRVRMVWGWVAAIGMALMMAGSAVAQTPVASPVGGGSDWRVSEIHAVATDARIGAISPDGTMLAGVDADQRFCVWEIATMLPSCAEARLPIRLETITWAPDGSAVAFALDAIRRLYESDVYVFELASGTLVNLTDDGVEGSVLDGDGATPIDDVPAWSPDGQQLAFARSMLGDSGPGSTAIMRVDRTGGEPELLHEVPLTEPLAVWQPMAWVGDELYFSQLSADLHDDRNGIYRLQVTDGGTMLVVPGSSAVDVPGAELASVDAAGARAIVYSPMLLGAFGATAEQPLFWLVDLTTGERVPLLPEGMVDAEAEMPPRIVAATYAPDGTTVLAWVSTPEMGYTLVTIDPVTGAVADLALPPQQEPIPPVQPQWVAGETVLLASPGTAWLLTLDHDTP